METPAPTRVDRRKQLAAYYTAGATPRIVDVPALDYLLMDGFGDPNTSPAFATAISALYTVSYGLKWALRNGPAHLDYPVMPLEGLWWADDFAAFERGDRTQWKWSLMIVQPPAITPVMIRDAIAGAAAKKPNLTNLDALRFEHWAEGPSAQLLHVGPYDTERPSIERLHAFIAQEGATMRGRHHEIYLNDMSRTAPERLKTILRQPIAPATR